MSEWGMARSSMCKSGWSALYGQAVGGFYESQDPQGSSSGSAIATSLKLASFTIGGETCGSILYPAQKNGVVGLKPTAGLTSRAGVIPLNPEQDSVGPITQYVKDSAIILNIIAGKDILDSATDNIPFEKPPDYKAACQKNALNGIRIAVPKSVYQVAESDLEVDIAFRDAITKFRELGAIIIDDIDFENWKPGSGQREDLFGDILLREAFEELFTGLTKNPHGIKNISDLIEFTKSTPEEEYDRYGANWFENARDAPYTSASEEFFSVKARMEHLGDDIARLLDTSNCDVLLATSSTDLPLDLGRLPGIQVPLGFYSANREVVRNVKGMASKAPNIPWSWNYHHWTQIQRRKLIACAYAFEQATLVVNQNGAKLDIKLPFGDQETAGKANKF
ncbi:amidase [Penicillium angulare]|uniref:Amidase n=1 Tax=Penicillium angulare TaxID=116970 RepID=A0A9W9EVR0_9EURO|nr:amidase [Penicillium angulare]